MHAILQGPGRPVLERRHRHLRQGRGRDATPRRQDRANDAIRVDAEELRCRVVGEGGNLGCTQKGPDRVRPARAAGSTPTSSTTRPASTAPTTRSTSRSCSARWSTAGDMTMKQRDQLLAAMTDEVGEPGPARQRPAEPGDSAWPRRCAAELLDAQTAADAQARGDRAGSTASSRSCPTTRSWRARRKAGQGPDPARDRGAAGLRQDDALRGAAAHRSCPTPLFAAATWTNISRARCAGASRGQIARPPAAPGDHRHLGRQQRRQPRARRVRQRARGARPGARSPRSGAPTSSPATPSRWCRCWASWSLWPVRSAPGS